MSLVKNLYSRDGKGRILGDKKSLVLKLVFPGWKSKKVARISFREGGNNQGHTEKKTKEGGRELQNFGGDEGIDYFIV